MSKKPQGKNFRRKILCRLGISLSVLFLALNVIAALHAWRFTHFTDSQEPRIYRPQDLPWSRKLEIALTGIENSRPRARRLPARPYQSLTIQSDGRLDCWYLPAAGTAKGTVILFHGYGSEKSGMLDKAYVLLDAGYNVLLPDFRGAGKSEGNRTTIGYREGTDVKACYDYIRAHGEKRLYLLGSSMGAVAVLKYLSDGNAQPEGAILECPFGTLYQTVKERFQMLGAPVFPGAALLVFWGGIENGFWGFSHNPEDYAKAVRCPTLLLFGEKDDRVTRAEIDAIYRNLAGPKQLRTYPEAAHNDYLQTAGEAWRADVVGFLRW